MSPGEFHLESLALTMVFVSTMMFLGLAPALLRFPEEFRAIACRGPRCRRTPRV